MRNESERFISIHIPKTGGTSLRNFYVDLYGAENVYLYYRDKGGLYRADKENQNRYNPKLQLIKSFLINTRHGRWAYRKIANLANIQTLPEIENEYPDTFTVLHGHFHADDPNLPDGQLVTVVREPLQRAASHFRFYKNMWDIGREVPEWYDPHMSFGSFALCDHITNIQSISLGTIPLENFVHVGVTSQLKDFRDFFDPAQSVSLPHLNITSSNDGPYLTFEETQCFKTRNKDDYELYRGVLERLRKI